MRNIQTREGYDLWDKVHKLPRFNFWRGGEDEKGSVIRVPEKHGNWVNFNDLTTLADEYQDEINILRDRLARLEPKLVEVTTTGGSCVHSYHLGECTKCGAISPTE